MSLHNNIKTYFTEKHIGVPDEWISACMEWVQSEHPELGQNRSNTRVIVDKVYEQWLHSDLTELASCCLPFGLAQKRSTTMNGHFALQVNQVRDVGQAAYLQLQKLRQVDNGNARVSADQQHQPSWEPKPTRMLMIQMTDGTSVVQGMEYRSIPHLNVNLKPGTKVLLSGTIKARRGILLLTREHITVLGGEAESLLITNAVENVLARALGAEETEQPNQLEELVATQIPPSQASQYYPSQLNGVSSRSQNVSQVARGGRSLTSSETTRAGVGSRASSSSINRQQPNTIIHPAVSLDDLGDDDFLDSGLEAALNQIETQAGSSTSNYGHANSKCVNNTMTGNHSSQMNDNRDMPNDRVNSSSMSFTSQSNVSFQNSELAMDVGDEFFNDDFDDEILVSAAESTVNQSDGQTSSLFHPAENVTKQSTNSFKSSSQVSNNSLLAPARPSSFHGKQTIVLPTKPSAPVRSDASQKVTKIGRVTPLTKNKKMAGKQSRLTSFLSKSSGGSQRDTTRPSLSLSQSKASSAVDIMEEDFIVPLEAEHSIPGDINTHRNKENPTPANIVKGTKTIQNEQPFTYLFYLPDKPSKTEVFVIKGFIMTLISKLEQSDGKWNLIVIINDGSASCEVDIDDKILRRLIGMNVEEFNIKKVEARINPILRSQLTKSVSGCQQKLISLCSLLKLTVSPNSLRPRLTEIIPVSSTVATQLSQRSSL